MKNSDIAAYGWDRKLDDDELLTRLASLKAKAAQATPILDDDDLEAAIDEAADRLTGAS